MEKSDVNKTQVQERTVRVESHGFKRHLAKSSVPAVSECDTQRLDYDLGPTVWNGLPRLAHSCAQSSATKTSVDPLPSVCRSQWE